MSRKQVASLVQTMLLVCIVSLCSSACTIVSHTQKNSTEPDPVQVVGLGLISGNWVGSSVCQAPEGVKRYPIALNIVHQGEEQYSGILNIQGISENGGNLIPLEKISITIASVDGEYSARYGIFMPFLRTRLHITLDGDGGVSTLDFTTIQRCRSFQLTRGSKNK